LPFSFSLGKSLPIPLFFLPNRERTSFSSCEAFARTCVSGLILDPEVPIRAIFDHHQDSPYHQPTAAASIAHPVPSTSANHLSRKGTLLHRFRNFYGNITEPFALSHGTSAGHTHTVSSSSMGRATTPAAASSITLVGPVPSNRKRADTTATLLEKPSSLPPPSTSRQQQQQQQQEKEVLFLPFQFSVNLSRRVTRRNLPYLRHSWTRTDAVSIVAFWITFVLAQTGVEHGAARHLGVFRALSVLRTARLLSITSGTTVGDYDIFACFGWTSLFSPLDYHALTQDCASVTRQRSIFCAVCHDIIFVRSRSRSTVRVMWLMTDFPVGLLVSSHSMARCSGHATWSQSLVRAKHHSTIFAGVTSIRARSPMCRISHVMDVTSRLRGIYVPLDRSARSV